MPVGISKIAIYGVNDNSRTDPRAHKKSTPFPVFTALQTCKLIPELHSSDIFALVSSNNLKLVLEKEGVT